MTLFRVVVFHLRRIFDRANVEREVDLEFRDHIERETKANMARGISERAARRAALIVFGGVQQYKEDVRDTRPLRRLEQLGQDVRFALRTLRRAPGFSAVAILTIALGVGATSAVFTVVNDVLLRPLPFEQADHLYLLSYLPPGFFGGAALGVADRLCLAFEREQRSFASTSCYQRAQFTITGAGPAERSVDTGYDASRVTTMSVDLPPTAYPTAEQVRLFHTNVLARLAGIPGVQSVGAVSWRPMGDMGIMGDFRVHGATPLPKGYTVDKPAVSPGYFRAMGIRLLEGRDFTSADGPGTPGVVIVSESVARSVWPGQSAIGKRISMVDNPGAGDWLTVVGVVRDVVQDQGFARHSTVYMSYLQAKPPFFISHMSYVVRTMPGRASVAGAMRHALSGIDPAIPAEALQTMNASMLDLVAGFVFQTTLLSTFSLLALLLAAIGTYGVLAYDVAERTREIGIRMALGARSDRVLRMVMGRTLVLAGVGIAIGVIGALGTTRVLSRFLFGISPTDPAAFGATAAVLVCVALAAATLPAWRASRVDPVIAFKEE